jgi:mRNA interferase MazF
MKRGEIRWYAFQRPDKNRPVLVLTRDSVLDYLGEVTVAPVTRTIRDIPSEVPLSKSDGLTGDCAINCDHLQTVTKARLGSLVATLSPAKMLQVRSAIAFALGL